MAHRRVSTVIKRPLHAPRSRTALLLSTVLLAASTPLIAAEQQDQLVATNSLFGWESFLQMTFGLVAVVGIIIFLSIVIRRFSLLPGTSSGMIKILGGLALNNKDRLLLIQVGQEQILISASPGRVGKIHDMQQFVDPESFKAPQRADAVTFKSLLDRASRKAAP